MFSFFPALQHYLRSPAKCVVQELSKEPDFGIERATKQTSTMLQWATFFGKVPIIIRNETVPFEEILCP